MINVENGHAHVKGDGMQLMTDSVVAVCTTVHAVVGEDRKEDANVILHAIVGTTIKTLKKPPYNLDVTFGFLGHALLEEEETAPQDAGTSTGAET